MPSQIFKGKVFAAAGPLPGQFTVDNLKRWTSLRKGIFLDDFDESVTHLLCTREQWDEKVPRIKQALKRHKNFPIIHCDWYEFSTVHDKKLPERDYSMRSLLAKQNAKRREKERWEKGIQQGKKFVNTNFYHLYRDRLNFVYEVDITRDDEMSGEVGQKYTLYLWESNAKPHLYLFAARFLKRKGSTQPSYYRPSPYEGLWRQEMDLFMDFFKKKTGIDWQDRVSLANTQPSAYFQYTPPAKGRPVGRRLRHDLDYCREINAEILGLPPFGDEDVIMTSPPDSTLVSEDECQEKEQDSKPAQKQNSGAGPGSPEGDEKMMTSPPRQDGRPTKNITPTIDKQSTETGLGSTQTEGRLETPPHDMGTETKSTPAGSTPPDPEDTPISPAKSATPAPSIDENGISESSSNPPVIFDKDTGMGISLEFEPRGPLT
ncbi:hypothetical protein FSPOR_3819 [Fusarium sporotrichioides]|uniref:BRCT domain-containing protein n=1 Tax=Fusarium sporotrichioides TaxID=5514 RepID=A0A395SFE0_FUSSP|nr:hypothetical protein FSPOR_3819 [Fusarium sporotrichioides]